MTDHPDEGLHIDTDWKEEARREKERLAREQREAPASSALPDPSFGEIVNLIVMQAALSLGGFTGPDGKPHAPDLGAARHYIDLLELLQKKTSGNLTPEEKQAVDGVLYELRMQFVAATDAGAAPVQPPPNATPTIETP